MWCTQCFGYYTEVLSKPEDLGPDTRPQRWAINSDSEAGKLIPAIVQRLAPHLLGYVPYITVWAILGHSFFYNVGGGDGPGPPAFVYIIVVGQFAVFTGFGIAQLATQVHEYGPSWNFWAEFSYQVLSLLAKGLLGLTLVANVLLYTSFDEALNEAMND